MDDIVAGKSVGGTTRAIAPARPGGQNLTAIAPKSSSARSTACTRPAGTERRRHETALKVLTRAQRWGAVMLIDEADVCISNAATTISP